MEKIIKLQEKYLDSDYHSIDNENSNDEATNFSELQEQLQQQQKEEEKMKKAIAKMEKLGEGVS